MHELQVIDFKKLARFRIEIERGALLIDRIDTREELPVEVDCVLMRGKLRRFRSLDLLERIVGVGAGKCGEHQLHTAQRLIGFFHRHDRVLERGRCGIVGDRVELGEAFGHGRVEGGREVGVLDLVEGRRLERQRALLHEIGRRGECGGRERYGGGGAQAERADALHGAVSSRMLWFLR